MDLPSLVVVIAALTTGQIEDRETVVEVSMVAVRATNEGRRATYFGPGLEGVKPALGPLHYDTYRQLRSGTVDVPLRKEQTFYINATYTLLITPLEIDERGRIQIKARITMPPENEDGTPRTALSTTFHISPGKQFNLGGLKLDDGDLIIVLTARH